MRGKVQYSELATREPLARSGSLRLIWGWSAANMEYSRGLHPETHE